MFNQDHFQTSETLFENTPQLRHGIMRAEYLTRLRERDRQSRSGLWDAAGRAVMHAAENAAVRLGTVLLDWVEARREAAQA